MRSSIEIQKNQEQKFLREIWELIWSRFKIIAGIIGDFEASVIAIGFYYTILVPFGLLARFSSSNAMKTATTVAWDEREPISSDIEVAKRQG